MSVTAQARRWEPLFWPLVVGAVLLFLWSFAVKWSGTNVFPSPLSVERGTMQLIERGVLWRYMNGRPANGHSDLSTLIDLSGDIIVNRNATLGLYYGHASSGAIAKAIYPSGDALHLAFMEWLIRF